MANQHGSQFDNSQERGILAPGNRPKRNPARRRPTMKPGPYKSQKFQDRWVIEEALPGKRNGYFVELAAADGVTHSNTYALENLFDWTGLCIEPNPEFYAQLVKNRDCSFESAAISDRREQVKFRIDNGQLGGVVADDTDNSPGARGNELEQAKIIEVPAFRLEAILKKHNAPPVIDYLSLDVEGCEERIIRDFRFNLYQFNCITVERPTPVVNQTLFDNGYLFVKNFRNDSFYVHPSVAAKTEMKLQEFEQIPPKDW